MRRVCRQAAGFAKNQDGTTTVFGIFMFVTVLVIAGLGYGGYSVLQNIQRVDITPVDQRPESVVRREFSERVHHRSVVTIELYWRRMIFSGRALPPAELRSDQEVIDFVRATPGGVGYVAAATAAEGVKEMVLER